MTGPPIKRNARQAPGEFDQATTQQPNHVGHRPELQGMRTDRNPCQPAPVYERPPGANAADELERLLRGWPR